MRLRPTSIYLPSLMILCGIRFFAVSSFPQSAVTISVQRFSRRQRVLLCCSATRMADATNNATTEAVTSSLVTEEPLSLMLRQVPSEILTEALTGKANTIFLDFLRQNDASNKRKLDDGAPSPARHSHELTEQATRVADVFCELASVTGRGAKARRSLEEAAQQLLHGSTNYEVATEENGGASMDAGIFSIAVVSVSLALRDQSDQALGRAAASAMASVVQRKTDHDADDKQPACAVLQALMNNHTDSGRDDIIKVDWHVVTGMARAIGMDGSQHPEARRAVAAIVTEALSLDTESDMDFTNSPDKVVTAAVLALAAQLKPWEFILPARLIEAGVQFDLWHAAERVCASVASMGTGSTDAAAEAVESLIDLTLEAKTYRRADTFATQFYAFGGKSRYLEARLLHACETIGKVVQKRALPVIERQIERIDKAAERVLNDGIVGEGAASLAKEEIRTFALRQLEEAGDIDAAHRLAGIYELEYVYDEVTLLKAAAARREKYLQWEEHLTGDPPDLLSTPEDLLDAFSKVQYIGIFGFDVEWSDDDKGAALLQISTPNDVALLIDVPALSMTLNGAKALEQTVGRLFASEDCTVIGFGCRQDVAKLRASPCLSHDHWFATSAALVDLQKMIGDKEPLLKGLGLSRVSEKYLGKPLDKAEQCSFWSARPLSIQQRTYAALDAYVPVAVYRKLHQAVAAPNAAIGVGASEN